MKGRVLNFEFEEFCFEYLNLFCQQELPVLIGVQLVPGIIKSKGWLAIATLKPTFTLQLEEGGGEPNTIHKYIHRKN